MASSIIEKVDLPRLAAVDRVEEENVPPAALPADACGYEWPQRQERLAVISD